MQSALNQETPSSLRGGSDALNSNVAIGEVLRDALCKDTDVPVDAVQVVNSPDRKVAEELMRMRQYIDVLDSKRRR